MISKTPWATFTSPVLACAAFAWSGAAASANSGPPPSLEVRFTEEGVALSGTVDSEKTGQALAKSVREVRPDLAVLNEGLTVDPETSLPDLDALESVLIELGLSTHEGRFVISEDRVLVGGLTDSPITSTALRIRLKPLLRGRQLIDRICIVDSDDLPDIGVALAASESEGGLDFDAPSSRQGPTFRPTGLAVEDLYPMIVMLSDLRRLEDEGSPGRGGDPLRAVPMTRTPDGPASPAGATDGVGGESAPPIRASPAPPRERKAALEPIRFSRKSVLLQAGQRSVLDQVATRLKKPDLSAQPVTLRPVGSEDGPEAFTDYLCERRGKETKRLLGERGIAAERVSVEPMPSDASVDQGEVRVLVELPEPESEQPDSEPDANTTSAGPSIPAPDSALRAGGADPAAAADIPAPDTSASDSGPEDSPSMPTDLESTDAPPAFGAGGDDRDTDDEGGGEGDTSPPYPGDSPTPEASRSDLRLRGDPDNGNS